MVKVIIVISTYNGAFYIEKQLDSIFSQRGINIEVLIRDDKSEDNTIQVIENYKKTHQLNTISIIKGNNLGFAKSFWTALSNSTDADYYAFADQDDIWKPDKLIKCINVMDDAHDIPQLSYCKMQRSDINMNALAEQVDVLRPEQLTKKLTLIKTYNYGAATVINKTAKNLVCRVWPEIDNLPHDMWVGILCYWFGKVHFVDEALYYWIRYDTSVTGEGTKITGIKYRLKQTLRKKSYPNVCLYLLNFYGDLLNNEDKEFLLRIKNYKYNFRDKMKLFFDKDFKRTTFMGTISLKIGILFEWY